MLCMCVGLLVREPSVSQPTPVAQFNRKRLSTEVYVLRSIETRLCVFADFRRAEEEEEEICAVLQGRKGAWSLQLQYCCAMVVAWMFG